MALSSPVYCTREDVAAALDVKGTARTAAQIDAILEAARDSVEATLNRTFTPLDTTRYFDWPNLARAPSWRLWLDSSEVASVSALVAGGVAISAANYNLEPNALGPPYDRIEVKLSSTSAFASASGTHQRSIAVTGTFIGCPLVTAPAGVLAEDLDSSETAVDVTDGSLIGVGDLLLCGTERMLVTGRTWLTSGQTLGTSLTASAAGVTVAVASGAALHTGEVILLDSERMLITDIAGNNLTVKRAWDGSVLATHAGSTVYASRTLTVVRGAAGTTAATHSNGATLTRHVVPGLVNRLAVAESLTVLLGEGSGYARPAGSGASQRPQPGSIEDIRKQAEGQFLRIRTGAA
jgi:hypothetical protein